jgi:hypothetical protein
MKPPLPIWSIPLMLAVLGIIVWVGNLSPSHGAIAAAETVLFCIYLVWRSRRRAGAERPVTNVLSLFPGHLLVLLAVSLLPSPGWLASLWALVPAASVAYDAVSINAPRGIGRTSTLIGLYAILWAALFTLLDRVIAIRRGFGEQEEIIAAVAFGVFGILFISLGILRHWRADKE